MAVLPFLMLLFYHIMKFFVIGRIDKIKERFFRQLNIEKQPRKLGCLSGVYWVIEGIIRINHQDEIRAANCKC